MSDTAARPDSGRGKVPLREVVAWCLYDFANSSYTTVIVTAFFVLYFKSVVVGGKEAGLGDLLWSWANAMAMAFVAVSSPILGAVADCSASKKRFLISYASVCIFFTAALYFVGPGMIVVGMLFFVLATIGFAGGNVFYDAFLLEVSTEENMGRISGCGWAVGYIGGLLCLAAVFPFARTLDPSLGEEGTRLARLTFPLTALFFLVAALPTFFMLKEHAVARPRPEGKSYLRMAFGQFGATLKQVRRFKELAKFLLVFLVYNDAVTTVIIFAAAFAKDTLDFTTSENLKLLLVLQVFAAPGALGFGFLAERIGAKRTILITLAIWIGVCAGACAVQTKPQFVAVGIVAGLALGAVQSVSRTLVGLFCPPGQGAEIMGFKAVCGKFASALGPLVFGFVSWATGSQRIAVATIGCMFVISFFALMFGVDEQAGIAAARGASAGDGEVPS